jgi:hypothetical protein
VKLKASYSTILHVIRNKQQGSLNIGLIPQMGCDIDAVILKFDGSLDCEC